MVRSTMKVGADFVSKMNNFYVLSDSFSDFGQKIKSKNDFA